VNSGGSSKDLSERLYRHVDRLAGLIGPRHPGKPTSMEVTATYVEREFVALGLPVECQAYEANGCEVVNVVAQCPGGRLAEEVVILGAHYDTVPGTPGADDNASAVAMLIEVARLLQPMSFERTVRFVAFACEEPPHFYTDTMGSQVYARRCRARGEKISGMICLEMVGYYRTDPNSQQLPPGIPRFLRWAFPKRGDFLAAVGNLRSWRLAWAFRRGFKRATHFPLYSIVLPEIISEIRLSDNSSFWDQNYAALMITDTSFLRNPFYHTAMDTPDTLDYARMAEAAVGVAGGMERLAKRQSRRRTK
jgi:Zn-dependent M28 family amino/carboxypeptidase